MLSDEINLHIKAAEEVGMEWVTLKLRLEVWREIVKALEAERLRSPSTCSAKE